MNKCKVLKPFTDIKTKELYRAGQEVDISDERFKEMQKNLEVFGGGYLEMIPEQEEEISVKEVKTKSNKTSKKKG
ncbi:hypothetical protein JW886_07575 [Lactococcus taiwanensis]|uniref:Uncharacterized protein n=1 Tax=Lactococcus taiwanensis TaxID=1151742 RepID=A0AA45QR23_9LACT|nr:hypothetical protein [Lactococcus taiwanensis]QSE76320.1 hypothetical protein JW886_07575 [Lactococcus taiwanensis]